MRTNQEQIRIRFTGNELKLLACLSMLTDHTALVFGFSGPAEFICRHLIGRLAFPVFAFLLVQGFLHTGNSKRYFQNLFLFALLSELPYDLALFCGANSRETASFSGFLQLLDPKLLSGFFTHQNTLFTLSLGLLMLLAIKKTEALLLRRASAYDRISLARLLVILLFGSLSQRLGLDYGFMGMACIGAMYCFRGSRKQAAFWGCICLQLDFFSMPGAFLSLIPLSLYNGERGRGRKYFFYLFYPLHLLLLTGIKVLLF
ncbi:MAG: TraX family protein [Lachnospiraceae bacterium]|nr:TraX family protein [Lachnospiraceae bacterium]